MARGAARLPRGAAAASAGRGGAGRGGADPGRWRGAGTRPGAGPRRSEPGWEPGGGCGGSRPREAERAPMRVSVRSDITVQTSRVVGSLRSFLQPRALASF